MVNANQTTCGRRAGVSVLIASYGRPELLERAIESALPVVEKHGEIVVGDDLSDSSASIREMLVKFQNRGVRVVAHDCRVGMVGNWMSLIAASDREFIYFIGDDDILYPDALIEATNVASIEFADIYCTGYHVIDEHGRVRGRFSTASAPVIVNPGEAVTPQLMWDYFSVFMRLSHPFSMLCRREVFNVLRYQNDVGNAADRMFLYESLVHGLRIMLLPHVTFGWRRPSAHCAGYISLSSARRSNVVANIRVMRSLLLRYPLKRLREAGYGDLTLWRNLRLSEHEVTGNAWNRTGDQESLERIISLSDKRLLSVFARCERLVVFIWVRIRLATRNCRACHYC